MSIRDDIEAAMVVPKKKGKVSQKAAQYGDGMKKQHCGICRHFQPPSSCEIVEGRIASNGWCKYFEPKGSK